MKFTQRQLRKIIREAFNSNYGRRGYRPMSSNRFQNWSDIQSKYPDFYEKAEVAFQGYDGKFDGLNLQEFIRSIDPQWLSSKPLTSSTWMMFAPKEKERAQLEAVLLSIVRPEAANRIPNIEELKLIHKVR
jgi:hypothetical protein